MQSFSRLALGATGFVGWICWKGMEGTVCKATMRVDCNFDLFQDEDIYRKYKEEKSKKGYDEKTMMMEVLKRGGDSNLRWESS